ncbi:discoidin domain-containing protein [Streptacidiphilus sp. EB103A]|uniref:discoidin domain-containing protein n=1 Tax=Streptacidiphilus sp. EB103A TaxID=3156275 RepID=UPI0035142913
MRRRGRSLRFRTVVLTLIGLLVSMVPVLNLVPASAAGSNLALGKTATASSANGQYVAGNLNDGNQDSYWESSGSFPQWAQIDLGSATSVNQVVLKLPSSWGARSETLSVQGSTDGSTFATVVASTGYTFDPSSSNVVTINFGATSTRYLRINITANTGWAAAQLSEVEVYGSGTGGTSANLALGKTMSSSGVSQTYVASNANDGNQATYWESTNNAFPQWLQVDLGASVSVNQVVLKVPADTSWATRTQTLTVQGSSDGSTFSTLVPSAGYTFNPSTGNTSTISFTATTTRYVRITITANTGWPAGQISEFEVYGPTSGDTTPPSAPTNLAYTQPQSGQIALSWGAATDNVGVTGYDIYANNSLLTSVAGTVLAYTDTQPASATVSYFVRAHDAAGNQSANSNTVTRAGQSGDTTPPTAPTNLAYTQPQSGQIALSWGAATDNVGVTGYDIYRNGALATTVGGSTLTYTDAQPDTATVSYYVKAHDAAGNQSSASNTVTRTGSGGGTGSNLAVGKPITGTANTFTYAPANANDNDLTTYFEGSTYPSQLTVSLGANADVSSVVVKLNPAAAWSTRTQTIAVLGREQSATGFTTIAAAQTYTFDPSTGNSVSIPVSARVSDVELSITSNSGAPGGQVAEFQVIGVPAPNPDLVVSSSSWTPTAPVETDPVTVSATVANSGTAASGATNVNFYLGSTKVGTAAVGALAAGASSTVSANIGTQTAGSYQLTAKVNEGNSVIELNYGNNSYTNPTSLVVAPVQSSDLVASSVSSSPGTPSAGNTVTFSVTLKNQGTVATASGAHGITLTLLDSNNSVVKTLSGSYSGSLAPGATGSPVSMGTWSAVNGKYTLHTVIAIDANELPVKQGNNISDTPFFVGRGANMPYDVYEAENGMIGGGAAVVGPNRTIGDLAGEASGRKAVTLDTTGAYVQWNTTDPTNTLVTRFNIPDAPGGGGSTATLDVYVNGTFLQTITLNSKYEWLYGAETGPGNDPSAGSPRHIYDEAHIVLNQTVPADSVIKLQKDAANTSQYAIDYINTEMVAPVADPNPATYVTPAGFGQQDVQNALSQVANDTTGKLVGVYLPAGQYQTTSKFQVSGKAVKVVGAGPWYTQFNAPTTQDNTDVGWSVQSSANGSSFTGFGWFGDYTSRIDGPGKVFDLTDVANLTIDNIWIEHQVVAIWGTHVTGLTATNMRIRDTFADGINLTNGSSGNLVSNDEARSTGDDSFALFAAQDHNSSDLTNNTFQNLTAVTPWRAAGIAVYGGENNTMQNLYVADTLTYAGITISSLNFGYPFQGFGTQPTTIQNVSLVRDGGHFWNGQVFPAIWVFSATQPFRGIRVNSVDITDPTYSGIMFQTDYSGGTALNPVTDTIFTDVSITGAQQSGDAYNAKSGYGIWANQLPETGQGPAVGTAVFNHLTESNNFVNIQNTTSTFTITVNP